MDHFHYIDGRLHAEQVPLKDIAAQVGTPCYVYSRATLERHWHAFDRALADTPHLIWMLLTTLGIEISRDGAIALQAGLVADTLGFQTDETGPRTLRAAAVLHEMGKPAPYAKWAFAKANAGLLTEQRDRVLLTAMAVVREREVGTLDRAGLLL